MFRKAYAPGDVVPDGIQFWVHHYRHRLPHLGRTILKIFPVCATCGDKVRYEQADGNPLNKVALLRFDSDFEGLLEKEHQLKSKKKSAK